MNATTMLRLLGVRPDLLTKAVEMLLEKTPMQDTSMWKP